MTDLAIVIVTWNRLDMLRRCVMSARENAAGARIVVVDNASSDGTGEWLDGQGGLDVLRLPENTGGAGGFASGMWHAYEAGAEWILVMDDDVEILPGAADVIRKYSSFGDVIQLAKQEADGSECCFEGILDPKSMRRRRIPVASVPACGYVPCNIASFEGLLVRRLVIETIGVADASFFYGLDDLFYGYRASEVARFIFVGKYALRRQQDKSRMTIAGRRFYSSTPNSRYYHVRNYWTVMRYFRRTGAGSWRMYLTYAYESGKALLVTLLAEGDVRGFLHVAHGIIDGICGRDGK